MTKTERSILFLLASLNFTHILDFMIMMPLGNYLIDDLAITPFQFSLLVAAYSISATISGIVIALFIDRFDRKKPLLLAYLGFLTGTIACAFAYSYGFLLVARIVAGLFGGIIGAQVFAIVADMFVYERRGRAMGIVMGGFAAATILGVPLSLQLTAMFKNNWHLPFLLIGGVGVILVPLILKIIPNMTDHIRKRDAERSMFDVLLKVVRIPIQRNALLFSTVLMVGHFLVIPFITPYLEFNIGFSDRDIPWIFGVGGVASLMAALLLGRRADKKGKLKVFTWSVVISLFMVVFITHLPSSNFSLVLSLFSAWFIVATGRMVAAQAMITEVVPAEQRGSFMSLNGSVQQLGSGIAALLAGIIVKTESSGRIAHYNWVGYSSIVVLIGCLLYGRFIFRELDSPVQSETT